MKSDEDGASVPEAKIRLLRDPYSCEGHGIPKTHSRGQALWVKIDSGPDSAKITAGTKLRFKHKVYRGMGPDGLVASDEWLVLEVVK